LLIINGPEKRIRFTRCCGVTGPEKNKKITDESGPEKSVEMTNISGPEKNSGLTDISGPGKTKSRYWGIDTLKQEWRGKKSPRSEVRN
jgi:hypothetical protein